jgi:hypothetical protein
MGGNELAKLTLIQLAQEYERTRNEASIRAWGQEAGALLELERRDRLITDLTNEVRQLNDVLTEREARIVTLQEHIEAIRYTANVSLFNEPLRVYYCRIQNAIQTGKVQLPKRRNTP